MEKTISITGMKCPHCAAKVKKALEALSEVNEATVSNVEGTAVVTLNAEASDEALKVAVTEQGFTVTAIK